MKKKFFVWRGNLYLLQQFSIVFAALCIMILFLNSFMTFEYVSGNQVYSNIYFINPFDSAGDFGDSDVFNELLDRSVEDVTRFAVIKSQMETDGAFDGSKIIDIAQFAHRKEDGNENAFYSMTANYYLEDLIKWGRYNQKEEEVSFDTIWSAVSYFDANVLSDYFYVTEFYKEKDFHLSYDGNRYYYIDDAGNYIPIYKGAASGCTVLLPEDENGEAQTDTAENIAAAGQPQEVTEESEIREEPYTNLILEQSPPMMDVVVSTAYYYEISANSQSYSQVVEQNDAPPSVVVHFMEERYPTVSGGSIMELAANWREYFTLSEYLRYAVDSLTYNYDQYLSYQDEYNNSNLKFCLSMVIDGEQMLFGNEDSLLTNPSVDKDKYFTTNYDRYIVYCPGEMLYLTNTDIEEQRIFAEMNQYAYAYSEKTHMWVGIDTKEFGVGDKFSKAATIFGGFMPKAWLYVTAAILGVLVWGGILLYLCCVTGKRRDENGKEFTYAYWFDKIPTEIELTLGLGLGVLYLCGLVVNFEIIQANFKHIVETKSVWIYVDAAVQALILSLLIALFLYSLVRRIKAKNLWKNSITRFVFCKIWQGIKFICSKMKTFILFVYDNGKFMTRIILPCSILIVLNVAAGMFCYRYLYAWLSYRNHFFSFTARALVVSLFLLIIVSVDLGAMAVLLWNQKQRDKIVDGINQICQGDMSYKINMDSMHGENRVLADVVNNIGDSIQGAVETSMKDERLKADLITNVSHDIKTPLTSIINYVDLLKRENVETEPIKGYIAVLDAKSQRLKQLTDDLVEASKISSGNITLIMNRINLTELLNQATGEFEEKFADRGLQMIIGYENTPVCIMADSRRIWRVIENLLNNVYKYAMEGTRTYLDMAVKENKAELSIKNISAQPLNIQAEELTERFIRGDVSRSTEGSGLGLSIAKSLTEAQGGEFKIYLDGDLFKVTLTFPIAEEKEIEEKDAAD